MAFGRRRVTLQELRAELGLGELTGSYRVPGILGFLVVIAVVSMVALLISSIKGGAPWSVSGGAAGVAAALIAFDVGWNMLTRRLGVRRYLLYPQGIVKAGWFRPRSWVAWKELADITRNSYGWLELRRTDGSILRIMPGLWSRLPRALNEVVEKAGTAREPGAVA